MVPVHSLVVRARPNVLHVQHSVVLVQFSVVKQVGLCIREWGCRRRHQEGYQM